MSLLQKEIETVCQELNIKLVWLARNANWRPGVLGNVMKKRIVVDHLDLSSLAGLETFYAKNDIIVIRSADYTLLSFPVLVPDPDRIERIDRKFVMITRR